MRVAATVTDCRSEAPIHASINSRSAEVLYVNVIEWNDSIVGNGSG